MGWDLGAQMACRKRNGKRKGPVVGVGQVDWSAESRKEMQGTI